MGDTAGTSARSGYRSGEAGCARKPTREPLHADLLVIGFGKAGKTVAEAMGGSHTNLGNGSESSAPAHTFGLRVRRHARGMTFREIAKLHSLPGTDFREALLRCAEECLDCRASCTACADASLSESDLLKLTGVR